MIEQEDVTDREDVIEKEEVTDQENVVDQEDVTKAGVLKKSKWYIGVHAIAFNKTMTNKGITIKTANRILSSFTTFRYKKHRLYKTNDADTYAKTNGKRVKLYIPGFGAGGYSTIKAARYNSKKNGAILYENL